MGSLRNRNSVSLQLVFVIAFVALSSSCGKGDFDTPFDRPAGQAVVDTGANWSSTTPPPGHPSSVPCPSPSPSEVVEPEEPTPTPTATQPSPAPSPTPSPTHTVSAWCRTFPWWPGCPRQGEVSHFSYVGECNDSNTTTSPSEPEKPQEPEAPHNTNYCQVDAATGEPVSADQIFSRQEGDNVHSGGGGCIKRPILEVWGTFFNDPLMKPEDVDIYSSSPQPSLIDPIQRVVFAFDVYNKKNVPLINPDWTMRWFHAIPYGSFDAPNEVVINFQKVSGTGYIRLLKGGYVLDRVTDTVTSWAFDQDSNASQYGPDKGYHDVETAFGRARTGQSSLPTHPQSPVAPRRN